MCLICCIYNWNRTTVNSFTGFLYDRNRGVGWRNIKTFASVSPQEYKVLHEPLKESSRLPERKKCAVFRLERAKCYPEVLTCKRLYAASENSSWILVQHTEYQMVAVYSSVCGLLLWNGIMCIEWLVTERHCIFFKENFGWCLMTSIVEVVLVRLI